MEELKPLDKVLEPDERCGTSDTRSNLCIAGGRHHDQCRGARYVHDQFTIREHAYLYSWFFFPFLPVGAALFDPRRRLALSARGR